jgi:hypothetical protein
MAYMMLLVLYEDDTLDEFLDDINNYLDEEELTTEDKEAFISQLICRRSRKNERFPDDLSQFVDDLSEDDMELAWDFIVDHFYFKGLPLGGTLLLQDSLLFPDDEAYREFMLELTIEVTKRTFFEDAESLTDCLIERDKDSAINCVRLDEVTIKVGG